MYTLGSGDGGQGQMSAQQNNALQVPRPGPLRQTRSAPNSPRIEPEGAPLITDISLSLKGKDSSGKRGVRSSAKDGRGSGKKKCSQV